MNKLILALAGMVFAAGTAFAQAPASSTPAASPPATSSASAKTASSMPGDCEAKAMDKNGKPLAGAAKKSFMKKCEAGGMNGKAAACMEKAVDKNGKPLAGAAKKSFMKKCEAGTAK